MTILYSAYIFDFDFTLADASPAIETSVNYALETLGRPRAPLALIRPTIGMSLPQTYHVLTGDPSRETAARFSALFREQADLIMTANTRLFPHSKETLRRIKAGGCGTAIVTTKYRYRIEEALEAFGLIGLVDFVCGFEDVAQPKPDPEGLFKAMAFLGVKQAECLYVGDSVIDAKAAQAAGVHFMPVLTGATPAGDFAPFPSTGTLTELSDLWPTLPA